jgi:hypothetical protein
MGGFVAPGDALRGDNRINHRLFGQQSQGVRQRNAIAEHGADNRLTLHHRSMKLGVNKAFLQQLLAQLAQREIAHLQLQRTFFEFGRIQNVVEQAQQGAFALYATTQGYT